MAVGLPGVVLECLTEFEPIVSVELAGSRASGTATAWSDWDFHCVTSEFAACRAQLPAAVSRLRPVVQQWDRLSRSWCYMLILSGPAKVDLIFDEPHALCPPWTVSAETLSLIDDHFWDWMLWLTAKQQAGKADLVTAELARLHEYLLAPLGIAAPPATLRQAIATYRAARRGWEQRLRC